MIERLTIKNIAIIEEVNIEFGASLNVISGETGAGKSIIIGALAFLLGAKVPISIRTGTDSGEISGVFSIGKNIREEINELVDIDEDDKIIITRTISSKNSLKINGKIQPLSILREISPFLIDIHGQFEHSFLINESKHIGLLDWFCPKEMIEIKEEVSKTIDNYKEINEKLLKLKEKTSDERIELLKEYIEEFNTLNLKKGEEEDISKKLKLLHNHKENAENISKATSLVYYESLGKISEAKKLLKTTPYENRLEEIRISIEELGRELKNTNLSLDVNLLSDLENRFLEIQKLKRKHRREYDELLTYHGQLSEELNEISNTEKLIENLNTKKANIQKKIFSLCDILYNFRLEAKKLLENSITANLKDLNMPNVVFNISIEKKQSVNKEGNDSVAFLISTNLGEDLKPLAKVASGGEMSRVMLALKCTLAKNNKTQSFVFDEIDTGVSGRTAQKMAEKIALLGKEKQILCISHLPQIAAMADDHFLIEKLQEKSKTETTVKKLEEIEITNELARLIGGAKITNNTLNAATEMINLAKSLKGTTYD